MSRRGSDVANAENVDELRASCYLGSKVGITLFSSLAAMTFREHGTADLYEIWGRILGGAQSDLLRDGMRKLGIRDDEPPAVQAAKYHFFSNNLGGLNLEYIEESPQKVWLRYRAPYLMMPGIAAIAFPATLRRHQFSSWHPKNRHYLGYPRLGWVYTKTTLEGDPYDEGYFVEYDHDITDTQADGRAVVEHTPEYDPRLAPQLDPVMWPEVRQLKARRNYGLGYVVTTSQALQAMYGDLETRQMIDKAVRIVATQCGPEWIRDLAVEGSGLSAATRLVSGLLGALAQEFSVTEPAPNRVQFKVRPSRPFDGFSSGLRVAYSALFQTVIRHVSGRIRLTFTPSSNGGFDVYDIVEADRWLW